MNRLITFGCSFTYGQGLPDCLNFKSPSKMGWPSMLAEKLNKEIINISSPGASNLEILYNILNFNFHQSDTVVVMWTRPLRDLKFKSRLFDNKSFTPYKILMNKPWYKKQWVPDGDLRDYIIKSWIYMNHADLLFKSNNVNYLHYPAFPKEIEEHKPNFIKISNLSLSGIIHADKALDDSHPGLESNKLTSENIFKILCSK
jgi:hypothetical protein